MHCRRLGPHLFAQRAHQPALADARLAGDMDDRPAAGARPPPGVCQLQQRADAVNQRRVRAGLERLGAERPVRGLRDSVHRDRPRDALERLHAKRLGLETVAEQLARRVGQDNRSRARERLQARGDVGRLAGDAKRLASGPRAHLACDDDSRVQSNPHPDGYLEPVAQPLVQRDELVEDLQRGVDGSLRVVLVRPRIAEVGDHSVPLPLGRIAVEAFDRTRASTLVVGQHLAEVLGVQRLSQRRRVDDVAEHHRYVPSLGFVSATVGRRLREHHGKLRAACAAEAHSCWALDTAAIASQFRLPPNEQTPMTNQG